MKYVGNSDKERNKEVKKTVTAEKKTTGTIVKKSKLKKGLFNLGYDENVINSSKSNIMNDIIIVSFKQMIADSAKAVTNTLNDTINLYLFGETMNRKKNIFGETSYTNSYRNNNYINYGSQSRNTGMPINNRTTYDYEDILIGSRGEAEDILDQLYEILQEYESVSVANLYESAGITGDYTATKYGWYSLEGSRIVAVRGGFMIKLPKATIIK